MIINECFTYSLLSLPSSYEISMKVCFKVNPGAIAHNDMAKTFSCNTTMPLSTEQGLGRNGCLSLLWKNSASLHITLTLTPPRLTTFKWNRKDDCEPNFIARHHSLTSKLSVRSCGWMVVSSCGAPKSCCKPLQEDWKGVTRVCTHKWLCLLPSYLHTASQRGRWRRLSLYRWKPGGSLGSPLSLCSRCCFQIWRSGQRRRAGEPSLISVSTVCGLESLCVSLGSHLTSHFLQCNAENTFSSQPLTSHTACQTHLWLLVTTRLHLNPDGHTSTHWTTLTS